MHVHVPRGAIRNYAMDSGGKGGHPMSINSLLYSQERGQRSPGESEWL